MQIDFGVRAQPSMARASSKNEQSRKRKIIVALDTPDSTSALRIADDLQGRAVSWVKVGLQLFTAEGPWIIKALRERRLRVFLDLKLHDIPNTAREAVRSAARLGCEMADSSICPAAVRMASRRCRRRKRLIPCSSSA